MSDKPSSVQVVGVGARTAVGANAPLSAAAFRAGIVRFFEHSYMLDRTGEPMVTAAVSYLPDEVREGERLLALARPALQEALQPLTTSSPRLGLVIGLPSPRPGLPPGLAEQVSSQLAQQLPGKWQRGSVEVLATGNPAGLLAMRSARHWLLSGKVDFCLAGGVDSYITPETLEWLDETGRLKSPAQRWGFVPGEAAGFCLLTTAAVAERYGLRPLLEVEAVAGAQEGPPPAGHAAGLGVGLTHSLREALQGLPAGRRVHQLVCDLNGERSRVDEYGFSLARLRERFGEPPAAWTPADCWGDVGAASGPLFACLAAASGQRGYAKGPLTLAWTSTPGQECAAALFTLPGSSVLSVAGPGG